jgi:hypothetical protein
MSTIQNVEAVMQLEHMRRAQSKVQDIEQVLQLDATTRSEELSLLERGVSDTHSVKYATTSIQQSGHAIENVQADLRNAFVWRLEDMMNHFGVPDARRQELFAAYHLNPNDNVLVNYDVLIEVGPHPKNPQ